MPSLREIIEKAKGRKIMDIQFEKPRGLYEADRMVIILDNGTKLVISLIDMCNDPYGGGCSSLALSLE